MLWLEEMKKKNQLYSITNQLGKMIGLIFYCIYSLFYYFCVSSFYSYVKKLFLVLAFVVSTSLCLGGTPLATDIQLHSCNSLLQRFKDNILT